jgi:hypothetical protein
MSATPAVVKGDNHRWLKRSGYLELKSGHSVVHTGCALCGRTFLIDMAAGFSYAVHASVFSFHRLSDEVEHRWLNEPCPGEYVPSDDADRKNRVAELQVSWETKRRSGASVTSKTPRKDRSADGSAEL